MLTGIGLRNFKAFGEDPKVFAPGKNGQMAWTDTAPLSKITLIYGPNSGGKSSIIQALLLLRQSLKSDYTGDRRTLVPRGEFVDLGSFQSLIHRHEEERELGISFTYRNIELGIKSAENKVGMTFSVAEGIPGILSRLSYGISSAEGERPLLNAESNTIKFINSLYSVGYVRVLTGAGIKTWLLDHRDFLPLLLLNEELRQERERSAVEGRRDIRMYAQANSMVQTPGDERPLEIARARDRVLARARDRALTWARERQDDLRSAQRNEKDLELAQLNLSHEQIIDLTPENIPEDYERHLRSVNYLGPLRSAPERIYRLSSEIPLSSGVTGIQGEYSANVLFHNAALQDAVNYWLSDEKHNNKIDIPYRLQVIPLGDPELSGQHITIALTLLDLSGKPIKDDNDKDVMVTLADVGYGINQILPVIIEGIASQEGSILCVEQPEIHLHPRLQANIADLMIDTIADEPGKRKQWIVETHSELLILRLQRRIREGKIKPEDISVLYVDPNDDSFEGSAIKVLRLGEDSYFMDTWPDGFFDEGLKERLPDDDELEGADDDTNILDKLFSE